MLRYKTETRPGLVALYDIRPGNGAGQFLQPQRPHGASSMTDSHFSVTHHHTPFLSHQQLIKQGESSSVFNNRLRCHLLSSM